MGKRRHKQAAEESDREMFGAGTGAGPLQVRHRTVNSAAALSGMLF